MRTNYISLLLLAAIMGCSTQEPSTLDQKKKELEVAKTEMGNLKAKIAQLEKEISEADPAFIKNRNAVLVSPLTLEQKPFEHFTEFRGAVESRKNVQLSAQLGGEIERVYVREGQNVSAGQILVSLDASVLQNSLAELKSSYDLANTVFEKQEKLWQQKIGTELQYLQAKNNKESLEKRIAATQSQINQMIVKAPFSGTIDRVDALEGQVASPGVPLVRMVNAGDMYVKADVSEEFIGKFKAGDKAVIFFPVQNKEIQSSIASVGQVINPENRTFSIEVKLAANFQAQPNQVTVITLRDYVNPKAFSVPTKYIQRDNEGQFVYSIVQSEGKNIAKKVYVTTGSSYKGVTEVIAGLAGNESLVGEGFREVAEGAEINVASAQNSQKPELVTSK